MINDTDVTRVLNLDVREIEEKSESEEKGNFFFDHAMTWIGERIAGKRQSKHWNYIPISFFRKERQRKICLTEAENLVVLLYSDTLQKKVSKMR